MLMIVRYQDSIVVGTNGINRIFGLQLRKKKSLMHNNAFPTVRLMMPVFMKTFPYVFQILYSQSKNSLHAEGVKVY